MRFATAAQTVLEDPKRGLHLAGTVVSPSPLHSEARLKAFEETALPHLNAAYNLARWLTRNEHDAQDIVQESYLRAFRFFDGFKGGDGKAWLLTVVRNTFLTWRQRANRTMEIVVQDDVEHTAQTGEPSALERLVDASKIRALRNCIEQLPVDYREVLVMRELEEMSYKQISEVSSLPIGTVMSRLARARKRLAECMIGKTAGAGQ
jgi:RNA polymerase sigma-70 factor (ECF subfamily)